MLLRQGKLQEVIEHLTVTTKTRSVSIAVQKFLSFVYLKTENARRENNYKNNDKGIRLKRDELPHKADDIGTAQEVSEEEREKGHALLRQSKVQEAIKYITATKKPRPVSNTAHNFHSRGICKNEKYGKRK